MGPPRVVFTMAGCTAHREDHCGPTDSRAECTDAYCAQVLSRTHTLGSHRVLPKTSTQSTLLRDLIIQKGRPCLTRAGSSKNLLPQDYTLNYRQSHWLLSRFLFLFIRMPGSKGHLVHYFRLWNRFNMAFLSLTISHPPSRIVSMQNYLPYDNLRKE